MMLGLFGVCVAAAILELTVPGEARGGTKTMLRLLVVFTVLVMILTPLFSFLRGNDLEEIASLFEEKEELAQKYEEIFEETLASGSAADLSVLLSELLAREYGIAREDARVVVSLDEGGELRLVSVYLSGKALLVDPQEIQEMLAAKLGCEVEVR